MTFTDSRGTVYEISEPRVCRSGRRYVVVRADIERPLVPLAVARDAYREVLEAAEGVLLSSAPETLQ